MLEPGASGPRPGGGGGNPSLPGHRGGRMASGDAALGVPPPRVTVTHTCTPAGQVGFPCLGRSPRALGKSTRPLWGRQKEQEAASPPGTGGSETTTLSPCAAPWSQGLAPGPHWPVGSPIFLAPVAHGFERQLLEPDLGDVSLSSGSPAATMRGGTKANAEEAGGPWGENPRLLHDGTQRLLLRSAGWTLRFPPRSGAAAGVQCWEGAEG